MFTSCFTKWQVVILIKPLSELINLKDTIMTFIISEDCTACGSYYNECPVDAISEGDIYVIDSETCIDCGACTELCPVEAIWEEG
jgi:NAD-dependent dihydropyrimidine dehydrogenase PreA subunit